MALGSTQPLTEMSTMLFPGGKGARCVRLTTLPPSCAGFMKSGHLKFLEPSGPLQACNGTAFICFFFTYCDSKFCKRFLLPREFTYVKCPFCETWFWFHKQIIGNADKCDCYVQSCDNCGNILCSCSIRSILEYLSLVWNVRLLGYCGFWIFSVNCEIKK